MTLQEEDNVNFKLKLLAAATVPESSRASEFLRLPQGVTLREVVFKCGQAAASEPSSAARAEESSTNVTLYLG